MGETKLGEGAGWSVELTADEMKALASGISPALVRPDKLVYYIPAVYVPPEAKEDD